MPQAIVIGAGIVGLSCALQLRRRGFDVLVLEAGTVGSGASSGNAGWITPALSAPIAAPSAIRFGIQSIFKRNSGFSIRPVPSPALIEWGATFAQASRKKPHDAGLIATASFASAASRSFAALKASGLRTEVHSRGMLIVYDSKSEAEAALKNYSRLREFGVLTENSVLENDELQTLQPALGRAARAGIRFTSEEYVDPLALSKDLAALAMNEGVEIREHTPVARLSNPLNPQVHLPDGSVFGDATVVIAAGPESAKLTRGLNYRLPIQSGKGYSVTAQPGSPIDMPVYIPAAKAALTPFQAGMRIAGVMELGATSLKVSLARLQHMVSSAERYFAEDFQSSSQQDAWAGMRVVSSDSLPIIGAVPRSTRVFIATGHAMLGVTLGPLSGEVIAALAVGEERQTAQPFAPSRFM